MRRLPVVLILIALLSPAPTTATATTSIRVGFLREQEQVTVMSDRAIEIHPPGGPARQLPPGAHEIRPGASGIVLPGLGELTGPVRLIPSPGARLYVAIRPYRGILEVRRTPSGRLTVINELDLEEYLYGVLKMEVDPRWPAEALKAQAVAARTLAIYSLGRFRAEGYDVRATTESQVYGGLAVEDPRTTAAVDATRGEVVTYQGRPILAVYHSDSGGATESSEYVWGGRYPYLRGVPDPYTSAAPWTLRMGLSELEGRLRRAGLGVSAITGVDVADVTPSGRARTVRITSASGTVVVRATDLRGLIGTEVMKSTLFAVRLFAGDEPWVEFSGRGSGHGVGLSQWGARGQALAGASYADILRYYYSGVTIESR
ncbi:MAG: SpoIID/LytB domain-containing protein [Armatimonadota bacterium]|nr:SpoIID/LytB domain-containing protein [Armatimonadota bacterium]MDR7452425.1 SpoIID/LytB domain-containing protein [Armatimonadota bacterium]MDR7468084.1 SpoIID/LytB domain-containing protein [Armatimonadota bacterium]MDR7494654.1 SpoIID/LytB domain-containing protein [Armatimonadota bacterium]MDR7500213.1 SpoIID/LytB domain-containing protein [Armatimonadota bacterium]